MSEQGYAFEAGSSARDIGVDTTPGAVGDFDSALEALAYEVDRLRARIEPILQPAYDGPDKAMALEVAAPQSPLRERTDRLRRLAQALKATTDRVDL